MLGFFRRLFEDRTRELAPGRGWTISVVGESNFQLALRRIYARGDGHDRKVFATMVPEPTNKHDSNAILVSIEGKPVGYLPRELAQTYLVGKARCSAKVVGGFELNDGSTAHFGVKLNMAWPPRLKV